MKKFVQRPDEIRRNSEGSLDEVVVHDLHLFHLEQIDERSFWLGLTRGSKTRVRAWTQILERRSSAPSMELTRTENGHYSSPTWRLAAGSISIRSPL